MPKEKDLKKLVRARMAKTGESYSIAKLRLAGAAKPRRAVALPSSASRDPSAERDATLHSIAGAKAIVYEYDFGDSWRHLIEIENVTTVVPEAGVRYPICTGGARSRPPEDCGGTYGYEELLEALADPKHEEHARLKRWVGKKFDPEHFDRAAVNRALQKIGHASRRRSRPGGSRTAPLH